METTITKGVKISVEVSYQPKTALPPNMLAQHIFAYRITIENQNEFPVKLLRRHWYIVNSDGMVREVEGPGVVGLQPELAPKQRHQYVSACHLLTDMGKMYGTYLMINLENEKEFKVNVPEFQMIVPHVLN